MLRQAQMGDAVEGNMMCARDGCDVRLSGMQGPQQAHLRENKLHLSHSTQTLTVKARYSAVEA